MRLKAPVFILLAALGAGGGCSTSTPAAGAPAASKENGSKESAGGAAPKPTPSIMARTNPNIIEEDETHFVERIPKADVIPVDDKHFRYGISPRKVEFYKQDELYYYIYRYKRLADEDALRARQRDAEKAAEPPKPSRNQPAGDHLPLPSLEEFEDITPPRVASKLRFEIMQDTGLPAIGLWRASFIMVDMNGDGIPDIVAPPARLGGEAVPHIWLGDGKGHFKPWKLNYIEDGKPSNASIDYGSIAVGDIDGDGHLDMVAASHGGGLMAFFGDGNGTFTVSRDGLPVRDLSAQAVVLVDATGDGRLDIVASKDVVDASQGVDLNQVRLYAYKKGRKFEYRPDALAGAAYSYSLTPWDFDGSGRTGILSGSHYFAAQILLWKNGGNGSFSPVAIPEVESYAFHYKTDPGVFGPKKVPAFVDTYQKQMQEPNTKAVGINVYSKDGEGWTKHAVWRKKGGNPYLYAVAMGDLDGDGLADVVFPDSEAKRVRIFLQRPDGTFSEIPESQEPPIDSPAQCVRLVDVDRDGRLDLVIAKTVSSTSPNDPGGWSIYRNVR